jgi:hypothetical protein
VMPSRYFLIRIRIAAAQRRRVRRTTARRPGCRGHAGMSCVRSLEPLNAGYPTAFPGLQRRRRHLAMTHGQSPRSVPNDCGR